MVERRATQDRRKPPLDEAKLEELALSYVARFATTGARLAAYLRRKLRERDHAGEREPDIDGLVARFVRAGYIDDAVYGRARANDLVARGYGARRIEQALFAAGLDEATRSDLAPAEAAAREAALHFVRKRRFGPYGMQAPADSAAARRLREKQLAATIRAGHDFATARFVIEAGSAEEIEQWVAEARAQSQE